MQPTTTKTITRKNGTEVAITEWNAGAYTLTRKEEDGYTDWIARTNDHNLPQISDTSNFNDPTRFGVNWASFGTSDTAEAQDYAMKIMAAAAIAEQFNAIMDNEK